uniref:SCAN box domain-containing protein n=1 Tax=Crocodylus porosus TaxID=8502 RepID=A0A7M4E5V7_CROPO
MGWPPRSPDYDKVKSEILRRLDITPERHHQAFRREKSGEARAPRILWQHLADELDKWLRPESASKEEICGQVLMEQFMSDLDEDTQRWVKCRCPVSSREALRLAEQFDMAQGDRRKSSGTKGKVSTARQDKESRGNRRGSPTSLTCFLCRRKGTNDIGSIPRHLIPISSF